jgi:hypothetical protein
MMTEQSKTLLAKITSVVFHPLLMPSFLLGTLFYLSPEVAGVDIIGLNGRLSLWAFVFVATFILPSLAVFYLYRANLIGSMHLEKLSDRRLPYFLTVGIYGSISYFFAIKIPQTSGLSPEIGIVLAIITATILCVGVISLWWQISAHAVGISGVVGVLAAVIVRDSTDALFYPLLIGLVAWGLVLSARLYLNAHTVAQVVAGSLLGFVLSFGASYWFL